MNTKSALRYVGGSTVSGVLGWVALMGFFQAAWLVECMIAWGRK